MRFLFAFGLVMGFAYEAAMTWYATWNPRVHFRPHYGQDVILLYGLIGAGLGGLLAAAVGTTYRKIRGQCGANMTQLLWQIEREEEEAAQTEWPPPPKR